jgi:hypothetical protein
LENGVSLLSLDERLRKKREPPLENCNRMGWLLNGRQRCRSTGRSGIRRFVEKTQTGNDGQEFLVRMLAAIGAAPPSTPPARSSCAFAQAAWAVLFGKQGLNI